VRACSSEERTDGSREYSGIDAAYWSFLPRARLGRGGGGGGGAGEGRRFPGPGIEGSTGGGYGIEGARGRDSGGDDGGGGPRPWELATET
jgi:hypothetical protein